MPGSGPGKPVGEFHASRRRQPIKRGVAPWAMSGPSPDRHRMGAAKCLRQLPGRGAVAPAGTEVLADECLGRSEVPAVLAREREMAGWAVEGSSGEMRPGAGLAILLRGARLRSGRVQAGSGFWSDWASRDNSGDTAPLEAECDSSSAG